eukprot:5578657-Amphidinium_carterae.1
MWSLLTSCKDPSLRQNNPIGPSGCKIAAWSTCPDRCSGVLLGALRDEIVAVCEVWARQRFKYGASIEP